MPNVPIPIKPQTLTFIFLATATQEILAFTFNEIPPAVIPVMAELGKRGFNFSLQYMGMILGETAAQQVPDIRLPIPILIKGMEQMSHASLPQEATAQGLIFTASLILSGTASGDSNASLV